MYVFVCVLHLCFWLLFLDYGMTVVEGLEYLLPREAKLIRNVTSQIIDLWNGVSSTAVDGAETIDLPNFKADEL